MPQFFIYGNIDPCTTYRRLNDSSRLLTNRKLFPMFCDSDQLQPDWYRLISDTTNGNLMLPTHCTPLLRCQTISTGWMNGTHPTG